MFYEIALVILAGTACGLALSLHSDIKRVGGAK